MTRASDRLTEIRQACERRGFVGYENTLLQLLEQSDYEKGRNDGLDEAASMANARFLVDPNTSPAIHILGLKR